MNRRVDSRERRGIRLSTTASGRGLLERSPPPVQVGLSRALERMPAARLPQLRALLEQIAHDTEADRLRAPLFESG